MLPGQPPQPHEACHAHHAKDGQRGRSRKVCVRHQLKERVQIGRQGEPDKREKHDKIHHPFCDDRAEQMVDRDVVGLVQGRTACDFARTRHKRVGEVGKSHGVDASRRRRPMPHRGKKQLPAKSPRRDGEVPHHEGRGNPPPLGRTHVPTQGLWVLHPRHGQPKQADANAKKHGGGKDLPPGHAKRLVSVLGKSTVGRNVLASSTVIMPYAMTMTTSPG